MSVSFPLPLSRSPHLPLKPSPQNLPGSAAPAHGLCEGLTQAARVPKKPSSAYDDGSGVRGVALRLYSQRHLSRYVRRIRTVASGLPQADLELHVKEHRLIGAQLWRQRTYRGLSDDP